MGALYTGMVVVVPTRNRAEITVNAIRSALSQEGSGPLRVLVSDNSTAAAEAASLADFCERLGDARVTYARPPEPLSMSAHWDWAARRALELHEQSHVTFLTDRMLFRPGALARLVAVARAHPGEVVSYMHDKVEDDVRPVRVHASKWTGKLLRAEPSRLLRASAESVLTEALPRMLNCLVPRGVLEGLRERFGRYFTSIAPDFNFCYRLLATADSILFLDEALLVHYALARSNGASAVRGEMTQDRADFMAASRAHLYSAAPIPEILTVHNAIVHEYCVVREETRSPRFPPVDWEKYLRAIADELPQLVNPEARRETERLLKAHGWTDPGAEARAAEAAARAQPLWHKALSPRRVWGRLARAAGGLYAAASGAQEGGAAAVGPPEFETAEQALDYAINFKGQKLEVSYLEEKLGFTEVAGGAG